MKLFISWSGPISKEIAKAFREWIRMINQSIVPHMSEEDVAKGSRWSAALAHELEQTRYGVLILTPENTRSEWLHFEAGAIARSVTESSLSPVLFGLKPSDVHLPLSQFQLTEFREDDVRRLVKSINEAARDDAIADDLLERMFKALWPEFSKNVSDLAKFPNEPNRPTTSAVSDAVMQELLTLARQQARILANPDDLFGKEVLNLLVRLTYEEGTALRLTARERDLAIALTARWEAYVRQLEVYLSLRDETDLYKQVVQGLSRFKQYLIEFRKVLASTAKTIDSGALPRSITTDLSSPQ
jgi:hypothetical protein